MITGAEGKVTTEKDVIERATTFWLPPATWSAEALDGRWRAYDYADLWPRDKASLDIFWLKDDSLADSDKLPPPDVIAQEIVDDLEAALEQFRLIAGDLIDHQRLLA
jgi:type I restriction enzyme M protein